MDVLKPIFGKRLSQDDFAKLFIERLRNSGETGSIEYDPERFRIVKPASHRFNLKDFYCTYQERLECEQADLIHSMLVRWHMSEFKPPEDFADAKVDLLPKLDTRSHFEIDVHQEADDFRSPVELPHDVIAGHLAISLAYDLPDFRIGCHSDLLKKWGVTYPEAMEVAKDNLRQDGTQYIKTGKMYVVISGDGYDASRMVLLDFIRSLQVSGDIIAMVPKRDALYVTGSEDTAGLERMAKRTKEDIQDAWIITGMAFRLVGDDWEVWLPPEDHPSYDDFRTLYLQSTTEIYAAQKELLDKRYRLAGTEIFVASYSYTRDETSGRLFSYCSWTREADSLLPETDEVFLVRAKKLDDLCPMIVRGPWDKVRNVVGPLMEQQGTYPERWRVREFPSEAMLKQIGMRVQ